jgi:hypothetical protein
VCGFETDFPDEPRFCFIYDCPHRAQIPTAEPEEPAAAPSYSAPPRYLQVNVPLPGVVMTVVVVDNE